MKIRGYYVSAATFAACFYITVPAHAGAFDGPFVGIDIGYDHAETQDNYEDTSVDPTKSENYDGYSLNGLAGGIYAGYDFIINENVFTGVEIRAGLSNSKFSALYFDKNGVKQKFYERANPSFSATTRLGFLLNEKTGVYLRGGVAQTRIKMSDTYGVYLGDDSEGNEQYTNSIKDNNIGLLFGAGLETAVGKKTSLRVEYNVVQHGEIFEKVNSLRYDNGQTYKEDFSNHQVRLGLSYQF